MNVSSKQKTVYSYLRYANIRSGEFNTPLFVLYFYYYQYAARMKRPYVSPIEFGRRLSIYFEKGKSGKYTYYKTNYAPPSPKRRRYLRLWYIRFWKRMRGDS